MGSGSIVGNITVAGVGFPLSITASDEGSITHKVTVPKGYAGVTTSGVGTKAGVVTATNTSPDIDTNDYVDIYWELDGVRGVLYNCDVSDVTAGAVTFIDTNGQGDNLPANGTAMVVSVRKIIAGEFEAGDASIIAAQCSDGRSHIAYVEGSPAAGSVHFAQDIIDGWGWVWSDQFVDIANPMAGDTVDNIWVSTANTEADQTFDTAVLYDSVS